MTSINKISKSLTSILSNLNILHSLEGVNLVNEAQLQVGENSNLITGPGEPPEDGEMKEMTLPSRPGFYIRALSV